MSSQTGTFTTIIKASFWRRLIAFVFDDLLIALLSRLVGLIFTLPDTIEYWFFFLLFYSYNIFCDYHHQATLGKMIMKLKVVGLEGQRPEFGNVVYRNFGKIISALPLFYGFLRILAPHQRQTIHDELGKCFVTEKNGRKES